MNFINEGFDIKKGTFVKKDGNTIPIVYIESTDGDDTYQYKDTLKKKFGASWFNSIKSWGWFAGNNPSDVVKNKVEPCLRWLNTVAKSGNIPDENGIIQKINELIRALDANAGAEDTAGDDVVVTSAEAIKRRLEEFKRELINTVSSDEFKKKFEPIIKFRQAQGHKFSFLNSLLIFVQDPKATMVKSRKRWLAVNREVIPGSPAIWLWVPRGTSSTTPEEKEMIKNAFLRRVKKDSVDQLTPGEKEELDIQMRKNSAEHFDLGPYFFDYRFTKQIEGKDDLVGNPNVDAPWYDDKGDETDMLTQFINNMTNAILASGVKIEYVNDLDGARGLSANGVIKLLKEPKRNAGYLNTIIHEFSHEVLHQTYLRDNNRDYSQFFVGREGGRSLVEQQAELCAWIVMKYLGYDMPTNINYVGLWGLDDKNAVKVFDSVVNVANKMIGLVAEKPVNESTLDNEEPNYLGMDGEDLADMVGCGKYYREGEKELEVMQKDIKESFYRVFNKINI